MALLIDVLAVAGLCAVMLSINSILGPTRTMEGDKALPYETGMPPMDTAALHMSVPYVRFALLFVVFDVELALLLPAALLRDQLTAGVVAAVTVFVAFLTLMLAYVWKKGALRLL